MVRDGYILGDEGNGMNGADGEKDGGLTGFSR